MADKIKFGDYVKHVENEHLIFRVVDVLIVIELTDPSMCRYMNVTDPDDDKLYNYIETGLKKVDPDPTWVKHPRFN